MQKGEARKRETRRRERSLANKRFPHVNRYTGECVRREGPTKPAAVQTRWYINIKRKEKIGKKDKERLPQFDRKRKRVEGPSKEREPPNTGHSPSPTTSPTYEMESVSSSQKVYMYIYTQTYIHLGCSA